MTLTGWAIENRVYAEDPYRGFLPSIGRLVRYDPPASEGTSYVSSTRLREGGEGGPARERSGARDHKSAPSRKREGGKKGRIHPRR